MKHLIEIINDIEPNRVFVVSVKDMIRNIESMFPMRATVAPNSKEKGMFITPKSWHTKEILDILAKEVGFEYRFEQEDNRFEIKKGIK